MTGVDLCSSETFVNPFMYERLMTSETIMLWMAQKHLLEGVCDFKQPVLAHLYE